MTDAPGLEPEIGLLPSSQELPSHPGDKDPLLKSYIPSIPSSEELVKLLAEPPLTYLEATAQLTSDDIRKPVRRFCEICGYWGRVKCTRCGSRVCALECLRTHQEDCFTRYGA
jgi:zinc finger HIT domain-containing protein 1